jgi:hypothetical protein
MLDKICVSVFSAALIRNILCLEEHLACYTPDARKNLL